MVSRKEAKRQRWFDDGVAAFARVFGGVPPGYPCPICLHALPLAYVTLEHAPPRSVGGREVALTCRRCNGAGSSLDAELRRAEDVREWHEGTHPRPFRARLVFEGVPLNVDIERRPDMVTILGLPKWNDPANTEAQLAAWDQAAASGEPYQRTFTATFRGYDDRRARVALLRSAFIAAFAVLGYRYAYRDELDVVRRQIREPDADLIERFSLHRSTSLSQRIILHVTHPPTLECVLVVLGRHAIFLPGFRGDLYGRLASRKYWPLRDSTMQAMKWIPLGWPTRPLHQLDTASA